jgi:hypothetical protein
MTEEDIMERTETRPDSATPASVRAINGWGADLDPANRPAVPKEAPSDVHTVRGRRPQQQIADVKIFVSPEHPDITPVFGTTCPPRGLSGVLRTAAYKFGEGRLAHWMTLMLADRIDVIEGLLDDVAHAHVPNVVRERGWKSKFTGDRGPKGRTAERTAGTKILLTGAAVGVVVAGVLLATRAARRA